MQRLVGTSGGPRNTRRRRHFRLAGGHRELKRSRFAHEPHQERQLAPAGASEAGGRAARMRVTRRSRATASTSSATRSPRTISVSPPRRRASSSASSRAARTSGAARSSSGVSTASAIHGARARAALRQAARTMFAAIALESTIASNRSPTARLRARRRARPSCAAPARAARSGCPCGRSSRGALGLRGHVDLALRRSRSSSSSGGRSTSSTSSASSSTESGTVSRTTTPVICATTSLRLSTCCTLSVLSDVDAGVEQLLDVLPALRARANSGALVCASSSTSRRLGAARERGVEVELRSVVPRYSTSARRQALEPREQRRRLPARASRPARSTTSRPRRRAARRLEHRVRLAHAGRRAEEDLRRPALRALSCALATRASAPDRARAFALHGGARQASRASAAVERQVQRSTLTRGSPRMPKLRPRRASRPGRTAARRGRARATRGTW
jgi:hypothetical protein